jgi:hypothetical protein
MRAAMLVLIRQLSHSRSARKVVTRDYRVLTSSMTVPTTGHALNLHVSTELYRRQKQLDSYTHEFLVVTIKDNSCNGTYSCAHVDGRLQFACPCVHLMS